jgi:hypothetical protein
MHCFLARINPGFGICVTADRRVSYTVSESMHHDILRLVGRLMRAGLLFAIDGGIGGSSLTILHTIHLFIAFAFALSFLLIFVLFIIFAFGFEILEVS